VDEGQCSTVRLPDPGSAGLADRLQPEAIRANLLMVSLFLFTYEALMDAIVEQTRGFYSTEWDAERRELVPNERYRTQVLSLAKGPLDSSCRWLMAGGALCEDDLRAVHAAKELRNRVAHELPEVLLDGGVAFGPALWDLWALIRKVDQWFIREIHVPCDPDFDHLTEQELSEADVHSFRMSMLQLVTEAVAGILDAERPAPQPEVPVGQLRGLVRGLDASGLREKSDGA
jgi:hypothetical protein